MGKHLKQRCSFLGVNSWHDQLEERRGLSRVFKLSQLGLVVDKLMMHWFDKILVHSVQGVNLTGNEKFSHHAV